MKCPARRVGAVGLFVAGLAVSSGPAAALDIVIDYSTDDSYFFTLNPDAALALEAAASDLEDAILTTLAPVRDVVVGTGPLGATTTIDFSQQASDPATGGTFTVQDITQALDVVTVFAGSRPLTAPTVGRGGPAGTGYNSSSSGLTQSSIDQARADAAANAEDNLTRGGGPIYGQLDLDGNAFNTGLIRGSITFDPDTNWDYGLDANVDAGRVDFYSVALHELIHVLGIGTSASWVANTSGDDWTGDAVIALLGDGDGIIDADDAHFINGLTGTSIVTGQSQQVVMDPSITTGTRLTLTDVDLAALRDIGWAVVPEPATAALLALGGVAIGRRRRPA
jgi:hypothetical protein